MAKSSVAKKGLDKAAKLAVNEDGTLNPRAQSMLSKLLSVQRPVALAYVRSLRRKNPEATPEELIKIIRRHYLALTTSGGAAVGATAAVPGLGTTAALGVATAETAGFLEGTALFAQAISEIHGLPVQDSKRANALVLGLMLGKDGKNLVQRFNKQAGGTESMFSNWGSTVTKQLPTPVVDLLLRKLRKTFIRKFAARAGGSLIGRLLPFGIGAIIGGVVNAQMARKVADESKEAFGAAPTIFPLETDPEYVAPKKDRKLLAGLKNVAALRDKVKKKKAIESDVIDEAAEEDSSHTDSATDNRSEDDRPELEK
ncbi:MULTISPECIES: hypothetical protein [Brevibacterium]|uniref:EcsC protein family protein n=2 Tax=Brevibacterium TaxID=1696 RepID=A0A1H1U1B9_BRESA|nr:hypothetical protein [Brevibacterium sandarakinum]SDS65699.1 hypothetical protein SAMN04489751_2525 [Brevibacterium sandarakinum]